MELKDLFENTQQKDKSKKEKYIEFANKDLELLGRKPSFTFGNTKGKKDILTNSVNNITLPKYLIDQYEFWMYNQKLADAFDKKFRRKTDNPILNRGLNEYTLEWVLSNQNTPTSYYFEILPLDPLKLSKILGMSGEHEYINTDPHKERISNLAKNMREVGYDKSNPILIEVTKHGPRVVEGNHRIRAAVEANLRVIPVEWRWVGGTEMNKLYHPIQYATPKPKTNENFKSYDISKIIKEYTDLGLKFGLDFWHNTRNNKTLYIPQNTNLAETIINKPEIFDFDSKTVNEIKKQKHLLLFLLYNNGWIKVDYNFKYLSIECNSIVDAYKIIKDIFNFGCGEKINKYFIEIGEGTTDKKEYILSQKDANNFIKNKRITKPNLTEGNIIKEIITKYKKLILHEEKIVQAAFKLPNGKIIPSGLFHDIGVLDLNYMEKNNIDLEDVISGFITNIGKFLTRKEAANLVKLKTHNDQNGDLHTYNIRGMGSKKQRKENKNAEQVSSELHSN